MAEGAQWLRGSRIRENFTFNRCNLYNTLAKQFHSPLSNVDIVATRLKKQMCSNSVTEIPQLKIMNDTPPARRLYHISLLDEI